MSNRSGAWIGFAALAGVAAVAIGALAYRPIMNLVRGVEKVRDAKQKVDAEKARDEEPRAVAGKDHITINGVKFSVVSAAIGPVKLVRDGKEYETEKRYLVISIKAETDDETKKYDHSSWSVSNYDSVVAKDEFGNEYMSKSFSIDFPVGLSERMAVTKGKPIVDLVALELPLDATKSILLDLPVVGSLQPRGKLRFVVPRALWERTGE